ncbi:MAG: hypothetical protein LBR41_00460 [Rickettsiales bacterium]|jgi:hypothetical protein|nr:hypothetical protein [Rickettsiales bacterium]
MSAYIDYFIVYQKNPFFNFKQESCFPMPYYVAQKFGLKRLIVGDNQMMIEIEQQIKADPIFKNLRFMVGAERNCLHFHKQLTCKERERLYQIIKPIIQRNQ